MKEIKTCEEFVISRLIQAEADVTKANKCIAELEQKLAEMDKILDAIKSRMTLRPASDGKQFYIDFNSLWSEYDKATYDRFIEYLDLVDAENELLNAMENNKEEI